MTSNAAPSDVAPPSRLLLGWRVLVVGGSEFIGRATTAALLARGAAVTMANRGRTAHPFAGSVTHVKMDRQKPGELLAALTNGDDAGWDADFALTIPDDLPSGAYAVKVERGGHEDYMFMGVFDGHGSDGDACSYFMRDNIEAKGKVLTFHTLRPEELAMLEQRRDVHADMATRGRVGLGEYCESLVEEFEDDEGYDDDDGWGEEVEEEEEDGDWGEEGDDEEEFFDDGEEGDDEA